MTFRLGGGAGGGVPLSCDLQVRRGVGGGHALLVYLAERLGTVPYSLLPIACLLLPTIHYKPSTIFPLVTRCSLLVAILYPLFTIFPLTLNYLNLNHLIT